MRPRAIQPHRQPESAGAASWRPPRRHPPTRRGKHVSQLGTRAQLTNRPGGSGDGCVVERGIDLADTDAALYKVRSQTCRRQSQGSLPAGKFDEPALVATLCQSTHDEVHSSPDGDHDPDEQEATVERRNRPREPDCSSGNPDTDLVRQSPRRRRPGCRRVLDLSRIKAEDRHGPRLAGDRGVQPAIDLFLSQIIGIKEGASLSSWKLKKTGLGTRWLLLVNAPDAAPRPARRAYEGEPTVSGEPTRRRWPSARAGYHDIGRRDAGEAAAVQVGGGDLHQRLGRHHRAAGPG